MSSGTLHKINFYLFIEVRIYSQPERMRPMGALPWKVVRYFLEILRQWHGCTVNLKHCLFGKELKCNIFNSYLLLIGFLMVTKPVFQTDKTAFRAQRIHSSARIYEYKMGKDKWFFRHGRPTGRVLTNLTSYFCIPAVFSLFLCIGHTK